MKHAYVFLFSAGLGMPTSQAQQQFYADPFDDQHNTATGWVTNAGQLLGTDMLSASGVYA